MKKVIGLNWKNKHKIKKLIQQLIVLDRKTQLTDETLKEIRIAINNLFWEHIESNK